MNDLQIEWILATVFEDNSEQEAIRKLKREECANWLDWHRDDTFGMQSVQSDS